MLFFIASEPDDEDFVLFELLKPPKDASYEVADVWHIIFFSDPPNILPCEGTGIGYKSIVKLKFLHNLCINFLLWNIVSVLKLVYQNKKWVTWHKYGFQDQIVSRFVKKSLPTKILSSFALTTQPHQNIANRSD